MIRIVERNRDRLVFEQRTGMGVLLGPLAIAASGMLMNKGLVGWQVPLIVLVFGLWMVRVFGDTTHVILDKERNLVQVKRRQFLRGTVMDVLPLDSVQGVYVGRKAWAMFSCALYLRALDDLRVSGFQYSAMGLIFFSSHLASFMDVPCVRSGDLDPIGRIARGEKHPLDRLMAGDGVAGNPWDQDEHPLDRLVPKRMPQGSEADQGADQTDEAEDSAASTGRGPDGAPLQ